LSNALEKLNNHIALANQRHIRNLGGLIHSRIDMLNDVIEVGLWPVTLLQSKSLCHSVALSYRLLAAERLKTLCCFLTKCGVVCKPRKQTRETGEGRKTRSSENPSRREEGGSVGGGSCPLVESASQRKRRRKQEQTTLLSFVVSVCQAATASPPWIPCLCIDWLQCYPAFMCILLTYQAPPPDGYTCRIHPSL